MQDNLKSLFPVYYLNQNSFFKPINDRFLTLIDNNKNIIN